MADSFTQPKNNPALQTVKSGLQLPPYSSVLCYIASTCRSCPVRERATCLKFASPDFSVGHSAVVRLPRALPGGKRTGEARLRVGHAHAVRRRRAWPALPRIQNLRAEQISASCPALVPYSEGCSTATSEAYIGAALATILTLSRARCLQAACLDPLFCASRISALVNQGLLCLVQALYEWPSQLAATCRNGRSIPALKVDALELAMRPPSASWRPPRNARPGSAPRGAVMVMHRSSLMQAAST